MTAIPFWLKIVGPIVLFALVVGGIMAWGHGKYTAGHKAGVAETDKKWEDAAALLKKDAAQSATKADDAAANRLVNYVEQQEADQNAVDEAQRNGSSPIDVLFGS